jgi:fatty-acyl-CoA synthase
MPVIMPAAPSKPSLENRTAHAFRRTVSGPGGHDGVVEGLLDAFAASSSTFRFDDGSESDAGELVVGGLRVAGLLGAQGIQAGDRIAIRMANGADYVSLLLGCAAAGAVAVSVNTRYSDAEARDLTVRSGAHTRIEQLDPEWRAMRPIDPVGRADDPFIVFTTSGTTSRPKMVLHTQRSIVEHARDVATGFAYSSDDVVMIAMPLCGTFGLASMMGAVAAGARVIVTDFDVVRSGALIEREQVTCVNGSDDMFHRLLERGAVLSSIRLGGYARFNSSLDDIVERAATAGATITGLYGMSEVQALFSLRDPAAGAADRARAGGTLVSSGAAYRVVDGELQLRGPSLFAGYLAEGGDRIDAELTADHYQDGWFRTGDLAEPDGARGFEFVARMGDVLRLGGFLVNPTEIETVIQEVDGVEAAQVVSIDRPGGARPVAFVIAPGGFDEATVIERCRDRLARFKVPIRVVAIDGFPTTPSANGTKIQRVRLRELAADALDRSPD